MNTPKISVLVPVYKVEAYLQRCIDSVLSQDFLDWEMILVDDGSPDRCPQICDEAAEKDERIRVIHQKNGGVSSSRLAGFRESHGEWMMFVDGDDFLLSGAFSTLLKVAERECCDVVKGCNLRFCGEKIYGIERPLLRNADVMRGEDYLAALLLYQIPPYLWGGLYRRDLFSEDLFVSVKHLCVGEDMLNNMGLWKSIRHYRTIDDVVYAYYINPLSVMQSRVLSHVYHERYARVVEDILRESSDDILLIAERSRMVNHLRCFFTPEIGWDAAWYAKLRSYLQIGDNLAQLRAMTDPKFLFFISCRPLFYLYTVAYRILFFCVRLHGKRRVVLR